LNAASRLITTETAVSQNSVVWYPGFTGVCGAGAAAAGAGCCPPASPETIAGTGTAGAGADVVLIVTSLASE
jgi:hypothetical protein